MDDALIALVLIVVSLLSWLFQKGGPIDKMRGRGAPQADADSGPELEFERENADLSEEERARKFMEALGLPVGAPPPSQQRPTPRLANPPALPPSRTSQPQPRPQPKPAREDSVWDRERRKVKDNVWDEPDATPEAFRRRAAAGTSPRPSLSKAEADALARIESDPLDEPWGVRAPHVNRSRSSLAGGTARKLVADRQAARRAIIAREILGEPRGLQSLPGPVSFQGS